MNLKKQKKIKYLETHNNLFEKYRYIHCFQINQCFNNQQKNNIKIYSVINKLYIKLINDKIQLSSNSILRNIFSGPTGIIYTNDLNMFNTDYVVQLSNQGIYYICSIDFNEKVILKKSISKKLCEIHLTIDPIFFISNLENIKRTYLIDNTMSSIVNFINIINNLQNNEK